MNKHSVLESKLTDGIVTVFVVGSAAITTIEFERGLAKDFPEMLSRVAPSDTRLDVIFQKCRTELVKSHEGIIRFL